MTIGYNPRSAIVRFSILPDSSWASTGDAADAGAYAYDPAAKLAELQTMVVDSASKLYTNPNSRVVTDATVAQSQTSVGAVAVAEEDVDKTQCIIVGGQISQCEEHETASDLCGDANCITAMVALANMEGTRAGDACLVLPETAETFPTFFPTEADMCEVVSPFASMLNGCNADHAGVFGDSGVFGASLSDADPDALPASAPSWGG